MKKIGLRALGHGKLDTKAVSFLFRSISLRFADGGPDEVQDFKVIVAVSRLPWPQPSDASLS